MKSLLILSLTLIICKSMGFQCSRGHWQCKSDYAYMQIMNIDENKLLPGKLSDCVAELSSGDDNNLGSWNKVFHNLYSIKRGTIVYHGTSQLILDRFLKSNNYNKLLELAPDPIFLSVYPDVNRPFQLGDKVILVFELKEDIIHTRFCDISESIGIGNQLVQSIKKKCPYDEFGRFTWSSCDDCQFVLQNDFSQKLSFLGKIDHSADNNVDLLEQIKAIANDKIPTDITTVNTLLLSDNITMKMNKGPSTVPVWKSKTKKQPGYFRMITEDKCLGRIEEKIDWSSITRVPIDRSGNVEFKLPLTKSQSTGNLAGLLRDKKNKFN